ncbi:MAG: cell division protein FtsA [Sphingobium sp.]|nr:cell division protein FtsA [Sphingobium sp.]
MAQPRVEKLITAIDIGSWKVSALIAGKTDSGELAILGTGQRESRGMRRGYVADMERVEGAVRETIEQAERVAGTSIEDVWVGFSGGGLVSDIAQVEVELGGERIEQADIDDLLEAGRDSIDPDGRVVLHAQPALFTLDGLTGVKKVPIGMHANRLAMDIHVLLADGAPLSNLEHAVGRAYLNVNGIVASPIATGLACLTEEERDLGVAIVELGAGVTNVSLHAGGMLVGLASIGEGAADITDDIASAFGIRRSQAERIKCFYGSAMQARRDYREMIEIAPITSEGEASGAGRITRAELNAVICARLSRQMAAVAKALAGLGFTGAPGREPQVILTGGGAELKGMAEYAHGALGRAVRIGRPRGLTALPEAHSGPAFATLAGLALYGASNPIDLRSMVPETQTSYRPKGSQMFQRLLAAFRSNY